MLHKVSKTKKKLILASGSRIRRQLLEGVGLEFQVINSNVDEDLIKEELHGRSFREQVSRLASEKARSVSMDNLEAFVIGSDNMCTIDDEIFDKPIDHEDAVNHLSSLSGKKHFQNNGISIYREGREIWSNFDVTELEMKKLSLQEKIITYFANSSQPVSITEIAKRVMTSYECARRLCTEMYELGLLSRTKVDKANKGRPGYLYGPA